MIGALSPQTVVTGEGRFMADRVTVSSISRVVLKREEEKR